MNWTKCKRGKKDSSWVCFVCSFVFLFPVSTKRNLTVLWLRWEIVNIYRLFWRETVVCVSLGCCFFQKRFCFSYPFFYLCVCICKREQPNSVCSALTISSHLNTRKIISKNEKLYTNKRYSLWMYNIIFSFFVFNISFPYDINKLP